MRYVHGPSGHAADEAEKPAPGRLSCGCTSNGYVDGHDHRGQTMPPGDQPQPDRGFVFELAVATSAPVWPGAADGVKPVLEAVQAMLEKACGANMEGFQQARIDLEEAALQWEKDLFESEREP